MGVRHIDVTTLTRIANFFQKLQMPLAFYTLLINVRSGLELRCQCFVFMCTVRLTWSMSIDHHKTLLLHSSLQTLGWIYEGYPLKCIGLQQYL